MIRFCKVQQFIISSHTVYDLSFFFKSDKGSVIGWYWAVYYHHYKPNCISFQTLEKYSRMEQSDICKCHDTPSPHVAEMVIIIIAPKDEYLSTNCFLDVRFSFGWSKVAFGTMLNPKSVVFGFSILFKRISFWVGGGGLWMWNLYSEPKVFCAPVWMCFKAQFHLFCSNIKYQQYQIYSRNIKCWYILDASVGWISEHLKPQHTCCNHNLK